MRLVPGVKNSDARAVCDARVRELRAVRERHPAEPDATTRLGELLAEAWSLGLWRGRSVTSFEALCEQLLEIPADEARTLAGAAAQKLGIDLEGATEEAIATWMRIEAALLEVEVPGSARVVRVAGVERLVLTVDAQRAAAALLPIGRRVAPLAEELGGAPRARARDGDRDRDRGSDRDRGWDRDRPRDADRNRDRDRSFDRDRPRDADRNRDRDRGPNRDRIRDRDRGRGGGGGRGSRS